MCKKIYLLLSIAVLIFIICYVYSSYKQNYHILFKDIITYDDKTYFNLNGKLYSYDGKHIDLVIDSERDSEYCIVDNIIYCCCNYNDIISISKKGQNGIEIIYREDSLDKNLKNFFVINNKIIYITETYYVKIYN
ncbi:MAG: hypothetical protein LUG66_08655, partial [Clostridiales bacterium]|nr:hypothetical protein [Clostridiales bacterium]